MRGVPVEGPHPAFGHFLPGRRTMESCSIDDAGRDGSGFGLGAVACARDAEGDVDVWTRSGGLRVVGAVGSGVGFLGVEEVVHGFEV